MFKKTQDFIKSGWLKYRRATFGTASDNTSFYKDGVMTMNGDARPYKYKTLSAGELNLGNAAPGAQGVNASGFGVVIFADGADDYAEGSFSVPEDMDLSEDCTVFLRWSVANTSANMTWGYGYLITAIDSDTEGTATTGTQIVKSSAIADGLNTNELFTIKGGTMNSSAVDIDLYIYRDVSEEALGDDVHAHKIILKYIANKVGEER